MNQAFSPFSPEPVSYDASDETETKKRELEAKRRDRDTRDVLTALLTERKGRDWMWSLLSAAHMYEANPPSDPLQMAYREGERNIGLMLMQQLLRHAPNAIIQMMQERS